jgi:hypothetical protein
MLSGASTSQRAAVISCSPLTMTDIDMAMINENGTLPSLYKRQYVLQFYPDQIACSPKASPCG